MCDIDHYFPKFSNLQSAIFIQRAKVYGGNSLIRGYYVNTRPTGSRTCTIGSG